jgi:cyclophilin family peptidyl-prolyl cis-trans isomerase
MKRLPFVFIILLLLLSVVLYRLTRTRPDGMYAVMDTSKGKIVFRLHYDKVPITVANFVSLAQGSHPLLGLGKKGIPFYDNLTFHKLIPGVMVQGGDPIGTGNGGPGFRIGREFRPDLRHDCPGTLSMLNEGAFAHGSQFFITLQKTPRFDDKHSIFGEVVEGKSVAEQLEEGDTIRSVSIVRHGRDAAAFDLAYHLEELAQSARHAETEPRRSAQEETDRSGIPCKKVELPERTGNTDPARVPADDQPESEKVALQYLLVSHTSAVPRIGNPTCDKSEARKIAEHLAGLAREEGVDFQVLARRFSDSLDYRIPLLIRDTETSETMMPCFRLKPGQITDPIDTPKGLMVFKRIELELIEVRHILISYQGAHGSTQSRTREEAKELAEEVLRKAKKGEDFADLAREYSDSTSAKDGGRIGQIARGMTVPAFDHAAYTLKVGGISNVTLSPNGYQIIKRIR